MVRIPFNRAIALGRELEYVAQVLETGVTSGNGPFGQACEKKLEEILGARSALLTTSCTHALEISALLLDLKPGDEVILPSYTFVSTANAFLIHGAKPVFVDIDADTLVLNLDQVEAAITPKTRAIVPVHYAGVSCDMDRLVRIAERAGAVVIEDAAQAIGATYRDTPLGCIGALSAFSFHGTKNLGCGEGGALIVNDPVYLERSEVIREKGTNRARFFRGEVDKYTWEDVGSSYVMSDLQAAVLLAQLEELNTIAATRKRCVEQYTDGLLDICEARNIRLPVTPAYNQPNHHMFYLRMGDLQARDDLIAHLRSVGVHAVFHYIPLHLSTMGQSLGYAPGAFPVSETVADTLVRLPLYNSLREDECKSVIDAVYDFLGAR